MTAPGLESTAALLAEVFPDADRLGDVGYLRWLYDESPFGRVVRRDVVDEDGPAAHYAIVPIDLVADGRDVRGALSLNTAVHERARGGGTFVRLATETFAAAEPERIRVVLGVANANSTPGFERRLEFANRGPLPVHVLLPTPGRRGRVRSGWFDEASDLLAGVDPLLKPPARGLERRWTEATLRWRLSSPGARYAVHRADDALLVTTVEQRGPVSITVVLAGFAGGPLTARRTRQLLRAACAFHRAPVAIHAGHNDRIGFRGIPLPGRLRPSPLNLISRELREDGLPEISRFEFLDFDAY